MQWGIGVWVKHLVDFDSHIYVIATPEAFQRLNELKLNNAASTAWQRMVPISETIFPFTLEDTKYEGNKKTWVFQQLLKLYSYRVLKSDGLSDTLLLLDSDTVLVNSLPMRTPDGRLFVNIASGASGAFPNDAGAGTYVLNELFDGTVPKAYPDFQQYQYTAITHHMMMDGAIMEHLLTTIETKFQ